MEVRERSGVASCNQSAENIRNEDCVNVTDDSNAGSDGCLVVDEGRTMDNVLHLEAASEFAGGDTHLRNVRITADSITINASNATIVGETTSTEAGVDDFVTEGNGVVMETSNQEVTEVVLGEQVEIFNEKLSDENTNDNNNHDNNNNNHDNNNNNSNNNNISNNNNNNNEETKVSQIKEMTPLTNDQIAQLNKEILETSKRFADMKKFSSELTDELFENNKIFAEKYLPEVPDGEPKPVKRSTCIDLTPTVEATLVRSVSTSTASIYTDLSGIMTSFPSLFVCIEILVSLRGQSMGFLARE